MLANHADISAARALDSMVYTGVESPQILSFLRDVSVAWGLEESGLLSDSMCLGRVFSLDFLLSLEKTTDRDHLLELALEAAHSSVPQARSTTAFFCWQVKRLHVHLSKDHISLCSGLLLTKLWKKTVEEDQTAHPYHFVRSKVTTELDTWICMVLSRGASMLEAASRMCKSPRAHVFCTASLFTSIFAPRLMQLDFFSALDDQAKILFIHNTLQLDKSAWSGQDPHYSSFLKCQLLSQLAEQSDDIPVIHSVMKAFRDVGSDFLTAEELKLACACSSLEELLVKMSLYGQAPSHRLVAWLMCCEPKWLLDWAGADPESLDRIIQISHRVPEILS